MFLLHFVSSISSYDVILISLIVFVVYATYFYFKYLTRENPLPGPIPLPFVGNLMDRGFDDFVGYIDRMQKKHGKMFEIYFGPRRFIIWSKYDEDMLKMFDNSIHSKYLNRIPYFPGLDELGVAGKGVALNHDVKVWRFNRHFITRALLTPSFLKYLVNWTQNLVEEMMEFWKDGADDDGCFETDIVEWAHRLTTDSITHVTTGVRIHTIEAHYNELLLAQNKKPRRTTNNTTDATKFFKSIQNFVISLYYFILFPTFIRNRMPIIRGITKKHFENRDWLYGKLDEIIKQRRKEIEYTPQNQPLRFDMLTSMITAYTDRDICEVKYNDEELTSRPLTDEEIRGNLCEIFIAGSDTTSNSLTIIMFFLERYPNVLKKLREELDVFFKELGGQRLNSDNISKLVYTEAILKEVFRKYTSAPYTARNSTEEDVIAGRVWPKGTQYIIDLHGISNDSEYWDEPEKFNPDRWLNRTKNGKPMPNMAFGGGRRVCPGRKSASIQLKCIVALIYHKLDIELVDKNAPLKTKFTLLRSFPDLKVKIKPRKF